MGLVRQIIGSDWQHTSPTPFTRGKQNLIAHTLLNTHTQILQVKKTYFPIRGAQLDRGASGATVDEAAESDTTEQLSTKATKWEEKVLPNTLHKEFLLTLY